MRRCELQYVLKDFDFENFEDLTADKDRLACVLKAHFIPDEALYKAKLQEMKGKPIKTASPKT